ncbi:serine/threonine-protein kinase [Streptomyces buecherae]|uniref:serine/threonine-protein kinase n=1 Tax=Streptomyces buecherae TaxID=2763006 RepID=UPI00364DB464
MEHLEDLDDIEARYEVLDQVGDGGQGDLLAARDLATGRKVALKVQKERSFESETYFRSLAERLAKEGAYTGRLSWVDGIPKLLAKGRFRRRGCIVLEFVEGTLLYDVMISARPFRVATAASVIGQLCEILDAVHDARIAHRDVKPENIMVEPDGRLRLLDLGLATNFDEATTQGCGTIGYVPPEQLDANPNGVTGQADIFALGCLLLEMTVMQLPYAGTRARPVHGSPVLPPERMAAVPAAFASLAPRMVAWEAADRPANVREVFDALRPHLPVLGARRPTKVVRPDPTEYYRTRPPRW